MKTDWGDVAQTLYITREQRAWENIHNNTQHFARIRIIGELDNPMYRAISRILDEIMEEVSNED